MPAIITNKFRIHNSEQFAESFSEASPNVYYLGIGRPQPFATSTRPDSRTENEGTDTAAITPADSVVEELNIFDDLLGIKRIVSSNVSYVIPRRNWITSTIYDYYRHDYGNYTPETTTPRTAVSGATTLFDSRFYILNSENNVYKCLDNNNGSPSTSEPTGTSTGVIQTADNYKWKYMYSLTAAQQLNFLSTDFMAVATDATVSSAAVDGAIHIVKIFSAGTSGTNGTYTGIPIRGNGTGGTVTVTVAGNSISSVTVTNVGSGYTYAYIRNADIVSAGATGLLNSKLECIIEPKGGHGFDAVKELGGYFVMLNVSLEGKETSNTGDFTSENDFRRIVLIRDPKSGGIATTASTLRATKAVRLVASPAPGTFLADETITQATTGATGKVVEWDATNRILYYIQTRFNNAGVNSSGNLVAFSGQNVISGVTSLATGTPSNVVSETVNQVTFTNGYVIPEIDANSGDVLYIENRAPINRAADQTENIKLVIEF